MKMVLGLETKYGILTTFAEYSEREHVEPIAYDKLKWVTDKDILAAPWFLPKRDKTGPYYSNSKDFKTALSKIRSSQKPVSLLFFGEQETYEFLASYIYLRFC